MGGVTLFCFFGVVYIWDTGYGIPAHCIHTFLSLFGKGKGEKIV